MLIVDTIGNKMNLTSKWFGLYIHQKFKISPKILKTFDFQLLHEASLKCAFSTSSAVLPNTMFLVDFFIN